MTGIMDHPVLSGSVYDNGFTNPDHGGKMTLAQVLETLRQVSVDTNKEWAEKLGIEQSTAITCVKPSGTVSQLVDSASGIHARFSPYYTRTVRQDVKDPLTALLKDQGVPWEVDVMNSETVVFSFPQKAPNTATCTEDMTAMAQLKLNEVYENHWCEHKVSQTVFYSDDEFLEVMQWVWDNLDQSSGVSFLPRQDIVYQQAPYTEITKEQYEADVTAMPEIDWSKLSEYENEDMTVGAQQLACVAGSCEI
jgi:ribonucleoside-diphosphate reductase alpha chain